MTSLYTIFHFIFLNFTAIGVLRAGKRTAQVHDNKRRKFGESEMESPETSVPAGETAPPEVASKAKDADAEWFVTIRWQIDAMLMNCG